MARNYAVEDVALVNERAFKAAQQALTNAARHFAQAGRLKWAKDCLELSKASVEYQMQALAVVEAAANKESTALPAAGPQPEEK